MLSILLDNRAGMPRTVILCGNLLGKKLPEDMNKNMVYERGGSRRLLVETSVRVNPILCHEDIK